MDSPFESLYPSDARFEEIEKILGYIKGGNSCQLIGLPGTGRSNLLGFLTYNRAIREKHLGRDEQTYHFVLIDFSELKHRSLFDVTKIIFLTIIESLKSSSVGANDYSPLLYEKTNNIFKESLTYQDELILFQGLKTIVDILAVEQQRKLILLFERFEHYIPMLTTEFFTNLRILRDRAKYQFSIVFSLNRPLEELIETSLMADFYEFIAGHTVYLPINDAPGNAFRIAYLEKTTGRTISKEMQEAILFYTGGHGKLTRICMEALLNPSQPSLVKEGKTQGVPLTRGIKGVKIFLNQQKVQAALQEIWQSLSPQEQQQLASDTPCQPDTQEYLHHVGICQNHTMAIPLLAAFVQEQSKNNNPNQTIVFNAETNTIMQGDTTLSDNLTVSEFRLLRFLLEHTNQIVEKDDIIHAVWQETKSTEGVTDQALDQLVFRLRKKIEADPNNPQHIQTIKGRGIRFFP